MANSELVPLRTGFDVALRGYRRGQVREYVRTVEEELRILAADRDANAEIAEAVAAEVTQLRAENAQLRQRLDQMCRTPIEPDALQGRLRRMLELAKEEAAEITARAQAAAEHCWATAEDAAGRLRARYEQSITELDTRRRAMEAEHRTLMRQTRAEVAEMTTEADRRRAELDQQVAERRERVRADFELAMTTRRTEAMREIAEQKLAARAEADRQLRDAAEEAARRITTAQQEVDRLHTVQDQVTARLRATREVLTDAGALLRPVPDEPVDGAIDAEPRPADIPRQREGVTAPQPL